MGRVTLQRRLLLLVRIRLQLLVTIKSHQAIKGKIVLVDDDGKPLKKVDYPLNLGNNDEVEPFENEMASFLASKLTGVGYGSKSLLEQWRESNVDDDYDPYDNDMYEGQGIPDNIQIICGRKKK
ncbi:hypothetical protein Tco_0743711 [Tanacetum coccineum]